LIPENDFQALFPAFLSDIVKKIGNKSSYTIQAP